MLSLMLLKFTWKLIWQLFLHLIAKAASSFVACSRRSAIGERLEQATSFDKWMKIKQKTYPSCNIDGRKDSSESFVGKFRKKYELYN